MQYEFCRLFPGLHTGHLAAAASHRIHAIAASPLASLPACLAARQWHPLLCSTCRSAWHASSSWPKTASSRGSAAWRQWRGWAQPRALAPAGDSAAQPSHADRPGPAGLTRHVLCAPAQGPTAGIVAMESSCSLLLCLRWLQDGVKYAEAHRQVVAQWGRFPHRNAILGRTSTPEEAAGIAAGTIPKW